jgi:hypothetical protein
MIHSIVEEFFLENTTDEENIAIPNPPAANEASLSEKLRAKAERIPG